MNGLSRRRMVWRDMVRQSGHVTAGLGKAGCGILRYGEIG